MVYRFPENITLIFFIALSFLCCAGLSIYIIFRRPRYKINWALFFLMLMGSLWSFGAFFEHLAANLFTKWLWLRFEYLGICFLGVSWLVFSLVYTKKGKALKYLALLLLPSIFSYLFLLTNGSHHLFYRVVALNYLEYGPIFWVHVLFSYLFLIFGFGLVIHFASTRKTLLEKRRSQLIILGLLLPFLANIYHILHRFLTLPKFPWLTPLSVPVAGFIFVFALYRYRLFEVIPLALREIIGGMAEGFLVIDLEKRIEKANPTFSRLIAVEPELGKSFSSLADQIKKNLKHHEPIEKIKQNIKLRPEKSFALDLELKDPERFLEVSVSPILNGRKNILGHTLLFQDITQRKKAEKALETMMSFTVHELRTPLTVSKWGLNMLKEGDMGRLTPDQKRMLTKLSKSNIRLSRLVEDLSQAIKVEEKKLTLQPKVISLDDLIDRVVSDLSYKIREKKLTLNWKRPEKLPQVKADPDRVVQVLLNIIGNAVNFTPKGGKIKVEASESNGYVLCSIKDTGMGIPKDQQKKIFSKFFRARNVPKDISGTGLGLYISKAILDLSGGNIWFESEEGKGTTFYFTLPKA